MNEIQSFQDTWANQVKAIADPSVKWLWQGFIGQGNLTLLTSQWKSGKTTLLSMLISRASTAATWRVARPRRQNSRGHRRVIADMGGTCPTIQSRRPALFDFAALRHHSHGRAMASLVAHLADLHDQHGIDLAVIDPLAPFCRLRTTPGRCWKRFCRLAILLRRGMAVLVLHHPGKGEKALGQGARGSSALHGHVDISIEMHHPGGDPMTRRRRFITLSRYQQTPRDLLLQSLPTRPRIT